MARIRHVLMSYGDGEFSACGLAEDAFASGDWETDDEFTRAHRGLRVTCPDCCRAIRQWREDCRGLRLIGDAP